MTAFEPRTAVFECNASRKWVQKGAQIGNQTGAAIIGVLVVLALCTMLVSGLFAREYITIRSVENRASLSQIRWMERAVLDWVQVALRFDAMNDARAGKVSDECTEPWTVFVDRETQLDETTTGGIALSTPERPAIISGQVKDAQARFNLNNLIDASKDPIIEKSAVQLAAFNRLLTHLQLPVSLADTLADYLLLVRPRTVGDKTTPATQPQLMFIEDLIGLPGFTQENLSKLEKFVIFLPGKLQTSVNVNFAEPEVLAAVIDGLSLGDARRASQASQCRTPINQKDKISQAFGGSNSLNLTLVDVKTDFFLVDGNVRFDRMEVKTEALLKRDRTGFKVEVVWQQRK
jgi:general secretion pathway protein K